MPETPSLAVRLFGPITVRVDGEPMPHLRSRKVGWLLALLILRHGRPVEREWLEATLWPDSGVAQAHYNLRRTLVELRHVLGYHASRLSAPSLHTIALDACGADVDVMAFDEAIARGDAASLSRAVGLYTGPLLEGCTEEWTLPEREVREQACLRALERLAEEALSRGDADAAVSYLRRAVAIEPLRESTQRMLLQALGSQGSYAEAVQAYRALRLLLHEQLQAEPSAETQALYLEVKAQAAGGAGGGGQGSRVLSPPPGALPPQRPRHNLPAPVTSFIGRQKEMAEVGVLLRRTRLLTLTGSGGCGKTRLAAETAVSLLDEWPDGVWMVDLAPLESPPLVPQVAAAAVGVREEPGRPILETLVDALRTRRLLLLIDNCEHLLDACASLCSRLLRACPHVQVLATSRQALGIDGETTYRLPSLALPGGEQHLPPDRLQQYDAVRLFLDRACAAAPGFGISADTGPAVASICRRLDGMPLAIELAAARVRSLSVDEINARLDQRFRLLTGGSRNALPRHQTLRSLIDWSYDLLSPQEKRLFSRLSAFAGGWEMEAAEKVCSADGIEEWEVLGLLTGLVEKSLVVANTQRNHTRYSLLETIRQYARDRLIESDENAGARGRHRDFFLALAETASEHKFGDEGAFWMNRLEREHDNLRAALEWCTAEDGAIAGLRICTGLAGFCEWRGYLSEGRQHLARMLDRTETLPASVERGRALGLASQMAAEQGDYATARSRGEEGLAMARALGDEPGIRGCILSCAWSAIHQGDHASARTQLDEAIAWAEAHGDGELMEYAVNYSGIIAESEGDYALARTFYERTHAMCRSSWRATWVLHGLGFIACMEGDLDRAAELLGESMKAFRERAERFGVLNSLEGFATLAAAEGDMGRAARLLAAAQEHRLATGWRIPAKEKVRLERDVSAARDALGERQFTAAWAEGRALSVEQAADFALERAVQRPSAIPGARGVRDGPHEHEHGDHCGG